MKILISNAELAVVITNWSALDAAGKEFEKKIAAKMKHPEAQATKETIDFLKFVTTQNAEIKAGPVTITRVEKGIGITVDPAYVSEFMEVYMTSIIPMFNPMYDLICASKDMTDKLQAVEAKYK